MATEDDILAPERIARAKKAARSYCRQYMQPIPKEPSGATDWAALDNRMGDARDALRDMLKIIDAFERKTEPT